MDIRVEREALLKALSALAPASAGKITIPVLSGVRIETGEDAALGKISLASTDLEIAISASASAQIAKSGKCVLPAKRLLEIAKAAESDQIEITALENHWAEIRAGKAQFKLAGYDTANFPQIPEAAGKPRELQGGALAKALARVTFAISKEASHYTLNGALLEFPDAEMESGESLPFRLVATDGHRLAISSQGSLAEDNLQKILIPTRALAALQAILGATSGEPPAVLFAQDESHVFLACAGTEIAARKLTGSFPNYAGVLPKDDNRVAKLQAENLRRALSRVALLSDERTHYARLSFEPGKLTVSAHGEQGEATETLEAEFHGEWLAMGFNFHYLLDVLSVIEGAVLVKLKDAADAAEFLPAVLPDGESYRYIAMPMRA
jgi:DNA polymerase III subunit beta